MVLPNYYLVSWFRNEAQTNFRYWRRVMLSIKSFFHVFDFMDSRDHRHPVYHLRQAQLLNTPISKYHKKIF